MCTVPANSFPTVPPIVAKPFDPSARLARLTLVLLGTGALILAATLMAVHLSGVSVSARPMEFFKVLAVWGLLCFAWQRRSPSGGDARLRLCAGTLLVLFIAITIDVMMCFAGQTLSLPLIDPWLSRADSLIGVSAESFVRLCAAVPLAPELFGVAYLSSFPLLFGTILFLSLKGEAVAAWNLCAVFCLCLLVTVVSSVLFPAVGAFHYLNFASDLTGSLPQGSGTYHLETLLALRSAGQLVVEPTNLQGVATFPSFHTALALMTAAAWNRHPSIFKIMAIWQVVVIVSTIPIGGHYFIDLFGGALCWAGAQRLCSWLTKPHGAVDAATGRVSPSHAYV